jgi:hypothetical protein
LSLIVIVGAIAALVVVVSTHLHLSDVIKVWDDQILMKNQLIKNFNNGNISQTLLFTYKAQYIRA